MSYVSSKSLKDSGSSVYIERFIDGVDYTSGTTTQLTTSEPMPAANSVWVYFDGVVQHHSEYGVSGYSIIFTSAIPLATDNIEIQFNKLVSVGVAGENTVTNSMMTADNITSLQRKNAIINGDFDIWQRDTTQTATGYGSDDRWLNNNVGTTKTASQQTFTLGQTDVPDNPTYYSSTVVTSVANAANLCQKEQRIESVTSFAGDTVTISFWAKADASKNIATEFFQYFGTGGTPSTAVSAIGVTTHTLTTSWAKYTTTVTIPSMSGKSLGTDDNHSLIFSLWFDAGTNFDSRTNSLGQQSGTFDIAQVQIEKGSTATDFERRSAGEELALCQRYFQSAYLPTFNIIGAFRDGSAAVMTTLELLPTEMRAKPTGTVAQSATCTVFNTNGGVSSTTATPSGLHWQSSKKRVGYYFAGGLSSLANQMYSVLPTSTSVVINLDAEL